MFAAFIGLCWSVLLVGFLAVLAHVFDATAAILFGAVLLGPTCALAEKSDTWFRSRHTKRRSRSGILTGSSSTSGTGALTPQQ